MKRSSKIKSILGINENIWAIIQRYIIRVEIVPIATVLDMQALNQIRFYTHKARNGVVKTKAYFLTFW